MNDVCGLGHAVVGILLDKRSGNLDSRFVVASRAGVFEQERQGAGAIGSVGIFGYVVVEFGCFAFGQIVFFGGFERQLLDFGDVDFRSVGHGVDKLGVVAEGAVFGGETFEGLGGFAGFLACGVEAHDVAV